MSYEPTVWQDGDHVTSAKLNKLEQGVNSMSYTPTVWNAGDVVTAEKLNKLEQGVAEGGGGGLDVPTLTITVNGDTPTFSIDKTFNECATLCETTQQFLYPIYYQVVGDVSDDGYYVMMYTKMLDPSQSFISMDDGVGDTITYNPDGTITVA